MSKQQEYMASVGIGLVGIAFWGLLVAYVATKLAYPVLV